MGSWVVKALAQRAIGALPNPHAWNELFQQWVTHSLELTSERFERSLANCIGHLEQLERFGSSSRNAGFTALELGTGSYPTVALGLFLAGADRIWTWDIAPLVKPARLAKAVQKFVDLDPSAFGGRFHAHPDRLERLREVLSLCSAEQHNDTRQLLGPLGIQLCVGDASKSGLPAATVDLIVSDVVLEYLSWSELLAVFREFNRVGSSTMVMSHTISLDDQYAYYDGSITKFNFLRFSDRTWRLVNNPLIPLNRLRINDYRTALTESGFSIVCENNTNGDAADLDRTPLASRFRCYAVDDLIVIFTWLVATRRPPPTALRTDGS